MLVLFLYNSYVFEEGRVFFLNKSRLIYFIWFHSLTLFQDVEMFLLLNTNYYYTDYWCYMLYYDFYVMIK